MKKRIFIILIPVLCFVSSTLAKGHIDLKKNKYYAQKIEVNGTVVDENNQPLIGVSVLEKGTSNGIQTNFDGEFKLEVSNEKAVLVFSYLGLETKEVQVTETTKMVVILKENVASFDDVVVVGYGKQSRAKVTNAIATIKPSDIVDTPITSFEEGIAGQLSGVQIIQTSGDPGSSSTINIRGVGTLSSGTRPLLVVDGVPYENLNIKSINPNAIASVDILKDAASAAIYGSRGSNGIIIVTTKRGKSGKGVDVKLNSYLGLQQVTKLVDLQNAYERAKFVSTALTNKSKAPLALYQDYLIGVPGLTDTNWQKEILRISTIQNHNLTLSAGSKKMKVFFSAGYLNQDGIVLGSSYDRLNLRGNLNFDFSEKFRIGLNIAPSYSKRYKISDASHKKNGVIIASLLANPVDKPYKDDGSLNLDMIRAERENGYAPVENPVALALLNKDKRTAFDFLGSQFIEYEPIKGLVLKTLFGLNYSDSDRNSLSPNTVGSYNILVENKKASAFSSYYKKTNWMSENTINFRRTFKYLHNFNVLLGQAFQTEDTRSTGSSPLQFKQETIDGVLTTTYPLFQEKWALISYFGRVNYDFYGKYIFSASLRRDGSSRFGANTKWGWFPSASGAWMISQENIFKDHIKAISQLKLRGSWGLIGNNNIPNYGSVPLLGVANYGTQSGKSPTTSPNQNLSWEQTTTVDIGLDIGLLRNNLSFIVDYYNSTTENMLLNVPVPSHSGNSTSLRNMGKIRNSGFEFAVKVNKVKIGPIKWNASFNIYTNKNEVLALGPGQDRIQTDYHITKIGSPLGSYYTYKLLGVFNSQEQIDKAPKHAEQRLGDYRFADINNDGQITAADKQISGDFFPDYSFGFNTGFKYKNFNLKFSIQGKQGFQIFNGTSFFIRNLEGWSNGYKGLSDFYSASNPTAKYASPGSHVKTYEQSDLFVEDGSYVRLRKVSLSYSLPKKYLKKIFLKKLNVYVMARNLFTITGYTGYNPGVSSKNSAFNSQTITPGVDYGAYPVARMFVLGTNFSF